MRKFFLLILLVIAGCNDQSIEHKKICELYAFGGNLKNLTANLSVNAYYRNQELNIENKLLLEQKFIELTLELPGNICEDKAEVSFVDEQKNRERQRYQECLLKSDIALDELSLDEKNYQGYQKYLNEHYSEHYDLKKECLFSDIIHQYASNMMAKEELSGKKLCLESLTYINEVKKLAYQCNDQKPLPR
jgi:hypothetical protein